MRAGGEKADDEEDVVGSDCGGLSEQALKRRFPARAEG
jgi:hypothetical protein